MDTLQKILNESLFNAPYEMAAEIITDKIASKGVELTASEKERLIKHLKSETTKSFSISRWPWWRDNKVDIEVIEEEIGDISERFTNFCNHQLPELIKSTTEDLATDIFHTLQKTWSAESKRQLRERQNFNKRLNQHWGHGIDRLRMLLVIAREFGDNINTRLRTDQNFASSALLDVLTRLHARACQVTDEIICLISAGFADGAMARWRTLHEITIVSLLIAEHGEGLAKRYIDHQVVESCKAARIYRDCYERLGYEPMPPYEFDEICQSFENVKQKYGPSFEKQYGWAAQALNNKDPGIIDIEKASGVEHLRAHYKMASHNVHSNPKGVYFKLGLGAETDILLAGSSNFGLADPGHCAAISLLQVSTALGLVQPSLDSNVILKILTKLEKMTGEAFYKADQE